MQATFEHKPDFRFRDFVIEKTVELPAERFENMLRHPTADQKFLTENAGLMRQDGMGVNHCLLVTGEGRTDGLLVESEGYDYARYAAYVPEATALRYSSLSKMNQELAAAVDFIIRDGTGQTSEGNWTLRFTELEEKTGLCVDGKPFLQELLGDMLSERPEVADLVIEDGSIDVCYYLDFCPNYEPHPEEDVLEPAQTASSQQTLRDLIEAGIPPNTHLIHPQDVGFIPVTLLQPGDLHTGVLQEYNDILNAKVKTFATGGYGHVIELADITADRLMEFDNFLVNSIELFPVQAAHQQALRDLIQTPLEDIHLLHAEVEIEPATIVELSECTLTDAGKEAWADVLDAKVCRIYQGVYGLQVELEGVKPSRLQSFSTMLAGYCSEENYEKWVAQPEESTAQSPEMKL